MITVANLDRVLAYRPVFERRPADLYEVRMDLSMLEPYIYSDDVYQFIQTLTQAGFVILFDWTAWWKEAEKYINTPERLNKAGLETIQKLFTSHIRVERFSSGHLANMIQTGHISAVLNRLAKIRSDMATAAAADWKQCIEVVQGDITRQEVDAIVNAANQALLGGGGVDGAIHRAAGPQLLAACRKLGGCQTGQAKITEGYSLPARWVIHTVGPIWHGGQNQEDELLAECYRSSLALALQHSIRTIAFPAISAGVYGFPLERATAIAVREVGRFVQDGAVERVKFVCFGETVYRCYLDAVSQMLV